MDDSSDLILVVGAGASHDIHKEFGLGKDLIEQIEARVTSNKEFINYFTEKEKIDFGILQTFKNNLENYHKESHFKSIDEFLSEVQTFPEYEPWRNEYLKIGYAAILFHITGWEGSFKFEDENIQNTWIHEIIVFIEKNNLLEHGKVDKSLQILTFNYDRLLEYCLIMYYKNKDAKKLNAIKGWIKNNVIHIYDDLEIEQLEFGTNNDDINHLLKFQDKIQIAYENRGFELKSDVKKLIRKLNHEESKVGCIGFGFDYFNCRNIGLSERKHDIWANVIVPEIEKGSFQNRRITTNRIRTMLPKVKFHYWTCKKFTKLFLNPKNEEERRQFKVKLY